MKDKQLAILFVFVVTLGIVATTIYLGSRGLTPEILNQKLVKSVKKEVPQEEFPGKFSVSSSAFEDGGNIPKDYTCHGDDVNFDVNFTNVPENTKSIALIFSDPDAPYKVWIHWVVYNISPNTKKIPANTIPTNAMSGENDFGVPGYRGPCPPVGAHVYVLKAYALDAMLEPVGGANTDQLEDMMKDHIIDIGELRGRYSK